MTDPADIQCLMQRWAVSLKRVAAAARVSVPHCRRWLAGTDQIGDEAEARAESFLRSLKGSPAYDAHFAAMVRDAESRDAQEDVMRIAARQTGWQVDTNADGNPTYIRPAQSAEAARAGEDSLKAVRYGHSS